MLMDVFYSILFPYNATGNGNRIRTTTYCIILNRKSLLENMLGGF